MAKFVGVDLGNGPDISAVCVIEIVEENDDSFRDAMDQDVMGFLDRAIGNGLVNDPDLLPGPIPGNFISSAMIQLFKLLGSQYAGVRFDEINKQYSLGSMLIDFRGLVFTISSRAAAHVVWKLFTDGNYQSFCPTDWDDAIHELAVRIQGGLRRGTQ